MASLLMFVTFSVDDAEIMGYLIIFGEFETGQSFDWTTMKWIEK